MERFDSRVRWIVSFWVCFFARTRLAGAIMSGSGITDTDNSAVRQTDGGANALRGLPLQLDAQQFARAQGSLSGEAPAAAFERLARECVNDEGRIRWALNGSVDDDGVCWIEVDLSGSMMLQCQRCLDGVEFRVDCFSRLRLVPAGEPWGDEDLEDDSYEALELDGLLDTRTLVEDEVLLSLPIIPLHERCGIPAVADGDAASPDADVKSPFAALGKLKRS
jgi:uncharacterized protein